MTSFPGILKGVRCTRLYWLYKGTTYVAEVPVGTVGLAVGAPCPVCQDGTVKDLKRFGSKIICGRWTDDGPLENVHENKWPEKWAEARGRKMILHLGLDEYEIEGRIHR